MFSFKPEPFYNRTNELKALDGAWRRHGNSGQMMLLYGRRRLGKTFLLQRYFTSGVDGTEKPRPHCYYLAEQTTSTAQRLRLASQLLSAFPSQRTTEEEISVSWNALLSYFSQKSRSRARQTGRCVLVLDEFPYLVEQTPELPSIIQAWWDQEGVHTKLMVVLCGSQLSAMSALGHETAPLFGRFNAGIQRIEALEYYDVAAFYADSPQYGLSETLTMYGVFGGTPRYHALVNTSKPMAEEIVTLLMQPNAPLENEVRFLLGSEQIRDPALYHATLGAIASGKTHFNGIQNAIGVERGRLSFYLKTLQDLGWILREHPFGDDSDRRALFRIVDPFLTFWYRFVAPLASDLQFSDPRMIYNNRIAPALSEYMDGQVFEAICAQWLRRFTSTRLNLTIRKMGRYWSRDGQLEIDLMAELDNGRFLFGECKWRAESVVRLNDYIELQAKVSRLPEARWKNEPMFILFTVGAFAPELMRLAEDLDNRTILVSREELILY